MLDLDLLGGAAPPGRPVAIALDRIDEDPQQPRQEFDAEALQQLAATIARVGVRQPVSVRVHPTEIGRYVLNFGARRLRASRLAGKADIPAFVDDLVDRYDQVIENEQREPLTPMELALFVQRQVQAGQTRLEIAKGIGKSPQYVTYAATLIDAPDWLMEVYRSGRCRGLLELHELRRLHGLDPSAVEQWLAGGASVTRTTLQPLKSAIPSGRAHRSPRPGVARSDAIERKACQRAAPGEAARPTSPEDPTSSSEHAAALALEHRAGALLAQVEQLVREGQQAGQAGERVVDAFCRRLATLITSSRP